MTQAYHIPEIVREITQLVNAETAQKLVDRHGGTRLYIPKKMSQSHGLATFLGYEQALLLSQNFGGVQIDIPLGDAARRHERNREIVRRHDAGENVRSLVRSYRLTEKHIYTILKKTV